MKKLRKNRILSLVVACVVALGFAAPFKLGFKKTTHAEEVVQMSTFIYRDQISEQSKLFYDAINKMKTDGVFAAGESLNLIEENVVSADQVKDYEYGNDDVLKAFYDARDAYMLDHPEVFYVDFAKLSLNLFKAEDGSYGATLGAGRHSTYFLDGFNETNLGTELEWFNGDLSFKTLIPTDADLSVYEKIEVVNKNLSAKADFQDILASQEKDLYSVYGVLKNGKALAEGYAKTFKLCMDVLEIPCNVVYGYVASESDFAFDTHVWNIVEIDNVWYAVDTFKSDNASNSIKYLLMGQAELDKNYIIQNIISEHGKEFNIPAISVEGYFEKNLNVKIEESGSKTYISANYFGKNIVELADENAGVYIMACFGSFNYGEYQFDEYYKPFSKTRFSGENDEFSQIELKLNHDIVKICVTKFGSNDEIVDAYECKQNIICEKVITREISRVAPITVEVTDVTDSANPTSVALESGLISGNKYSIKLTYESALIKRAVGEVGVKIFISGASESIDSQNVVYNETDKTVTFEVQASELYMYRNAEYTFNVTNLKTENYENLEPVTISSSGFNVELNRIYDMVGSCDGLTTEISVQNQKFDIADNKWRDVSFNTFKQHDKKRVVVVSLLVDSTESDLMLESIKTVYDLTETNTFLVSAKTYEAFVKGYIPKVAENKNVTMVLPVANLNNVTYKVFSFALNPLNEYNLDEPVLKTSVMTQQGLIFETNGREIIVVVSVPKETHSPVVYVKTNPLVSTIKNITNDELKDSLIEVAEDEVSITVECEVGYKIAYAILNGKNITTEIDAEGVVKLAKTSLKENNVLEFGIVSGEVASVETVTNLDVFNLSPAKRPQDPDNDGDQGEVVPPQDKPAVEDEDKNESPEKNSNLWIVWVVVPVGVALVAVDGFFVIRKLKIGQKAKVQKQEVKVVSTKKKTEVEKADKKNSPAKKKVQETKSPAMQTAKKSQPKK